MDLDETIEQIIEIFDQETQWRSLVPYMSMYIRKPASKEELKTAILNAKGIIRERLKTLLDEFSDASFEDGFREPTPTEPTFDPHELD